MIIAIIQARMGSSRLPGKVLMDLCGKPVLWHVVNRVRKSQYIYRTIVATSTNELDINVVDFCRKHDIECFQGSENDVLDRFYQAASNASLAENDSIVRITADCPLIDPRVIDKIIDIYKNKDADYGSNVLPPTYPDGLDTEIFKYSSLIKAWNKADLNSEREHVTPFIIKNDEFNKVNYENPVNYSNLRWTLDQKEDYEFINTVYKYLYRESEIFYLEDIIELLKLHPELGSLNTKYKRNEGYSKSLLEDKVVEKVNGKIV